MSKNETRYIRKGPEKSKSPKKSHGKRDSMMEIKKDTTTNPHADEKKANIDNPQGSSHEA